MRLRSDLWVSAYLRRCGVEGVDAVLRVRGAAEAGAILVKVDRLDGTADLYGPAPQSAFAADQTERLFIKLGDPGPVDQAVAERLIERERRFDSDLWIVEVEDRAGRSFLDVARV